MADDIDAPSCSGDRLQIVLAVACGVSALLVGSLVVLPLAVGWSWAERTRGGTAVILAGLVVVQHLFVRLHQVWHPPG